MASELQAAPNRGTAGYKRAPFYRRSAVALEIRYPWLSMLGLRTDRGLVDADRTIGAGPLGRGDLKFACPVVGAHADDV